MEDKGYYLLAALRVVLALLPQPGYIHPDEFFQTIEILAGRIFQLDANIPWEFNVTFPIRSIGVPCITVGVSYNILQALNYFTRQFIGITIISPYTLLVIPRLAICLLSFLVDFSLYKICSTNNEKFKGRLILLASSFVMLTFGSRTFSNSLEMILFAMLLMYVADSVIFSNIIVRQREYLNKRYDNAGNIPERAKFHKLRLFLKDDNFRNCYQLSAITVAGFFNRPTFLIFAVFPLFFWFYRGIGFKSVPPLSFFYRILVFAIASAPTILFFVLIDSFFYGYISWGEIGMFDISIDNFVFPPFNFVKYNSDSSNLAKHGLHNRSLHLMVNIPLLFNVLGGVFIFSLIDYTLKIFRRKYHLLPTIRSIKGLMLGSILAPLGLLSYIPHQEARFIIPLILPIMYLYAHNVYEDPSKEIIKSENEAKKNTAFKTKRQKTFALLRLWLFANVISLIFFGFLHQAGVYSLSAHISKEINKTPNTNVHLVTSHTYNIPKTLFLQPASDKMFYYKKTVFNYSNRIFLFEEGGRYLDEVLNDLRNKLSITNSKKIKTKYYLALPGSLSADLQTLVKNHPITARKSKSFWPHVTTEALPDFGELYYFVTAAEMKTLSIAEFYRITHKLFYSSFTLNLYEVTLNR